MRYTLITILFLSFNLFSYNENKYIHIVLPSNETPQVITKGDAADDPAIWLNSLYPEKSLIFGTDKRSGIYIYDLSADIVSYNEIGNINNVDIRTVKIFDNYSDGFDSRAIGLEVKIQSEHKTLSDSEINDLCEEIVKATEEKFSAKLR